MMFIRHFNWHLLATSCGILFLTSCATPDANNNKSEEFRTIVHKTPGPKHKTPDPKITSDAKLEKFTKDAKESNDKGDKDVDDTDITLARPTKITISSNKPLVRDMPSEVQPEFVEDPSADLLEGDTYEEDPRDLIGDLVSEIDDKLSSYREEFGVESATSTDTRLTCSSVCELREAICHSSEKICNISNKYPQEPWFIDRCDWSGKECKQAALQCDTCKE